MTFTSPPAKPLPLGGIFSTLTLTPDELSKVRAVQAEIARIWEVATDFRQSRERDTKPTRSRVALDKATDDFRASPSTETAENYFAASIRHREVQAVGPTVYAACQTAVSQADKSLVDVVRAVGQRAVAGLDQAVADRIATTAKSNVLLDVGSEAREWEERIVATRQALEREITEGVNNPIEFLLGRDLVPDDHPEQPAAPVPPAKGFRGKVKLDKAEVPEVPADVLSQLDDGDEIDLEDPLSLLAAGT